MAGCVCVCCVGVCVALMCVLCARSSAMLYLVFACLCAVVCGCLNVVRCLEWCIV